MLVARGNDRDACVMRDDVAVFRGPGNGSGVIKPGSGAMASIVA